MPSYCVSGAGTTAYNGTYDPFSSSEYRKVGTPTIKIVYNGDELWYFINGSTEGYTTSSSSATPPLTGWTVSGNGTSPAPTLTEGACFVDPYCVAGADNAAVNGTYSYISGSSPTTMYFSSGYWEKVGGTIQIGYNNMQSRYTISEGYSDYYTADSLTGPWSVAYGGTGTAPTVTAGACGATPTPTVTAISPSTGTTAGGTSVTITGTGLTGATAVTIGGTAATGVTVVSSTSITATTPAGTAGAKSVLVTTAGGTNTANSLYTFTTPSPSPTPANIIRPKRSTTATAVPSSLQPYELAVNIPDKKIWVADASGTPVLMSELNDLPSSIDGGTF